MIIEIEHLNSTPWYIPVHVLTKAKNRQSVAIQSHTCTCMHLKISLAENIPNIPPRSEVSKTVPSRDWSELMHPWLAKRHMMTTCGCSSASNWNCIFMLRFFETRNTSTPYYSVITVFIDPFYPWQCHISLHFRHSTVFKYGKHIKRNSIHVLFRFSHSLHVPTLRFKVVTVQSEKKIPPSSICVRAALSLTKCIDWIDLLHSLYKIQWNNTLASVYFTDAILTCNQFKLNSLTITSVHIHVRYFNRVFNAFN